MKKSLLLLFLCSASFVQAQRVNFFFEDFNNGFPSGWYHYDSNWGGQNFAIVDSALHEASGPFFGPQTLHIEFPALNLSSLAQPFMEFEMAVGMTNPRIQISLEYTRDSIWQQVVAYADTSSLITVQTAGDNTWKPAPSDYQTISIDLIQFAADTNIRFRFVYDYFNAHATGVWSIDDVSIYDQATIGLDESGQELEFELFPNPTKGIVKLSFDHDQSGATLQLSSLDGKLLMEKNVKSGENVLDLSTYPRGVYLLNLTVGESTVSKRLVVE